ncbi:hypothetical protein GCK32_007270 [Trichostrongylus colubriformis]|uniref:G-protein coupled receptors family 1 profile domain-containing protein n=1 Tax=Trichostrongylus colubriformis TaxID=6319 RepID=A0AAN8FVP2_TRICO
MVQGFFGSACCPPVLSPSGSSWRFPLPWLCDAWQVTDFTLSTVSLYSICAIALDRILNLEKPLHAFKRSHRLALKVIFCVWAAPLLIWPPIYVIVAKHSRSTTGNGNGIICATGYNSTMLIFIVSLFVFYIPSILLIAMFARISMVVHKHFGFLRKHSNNPGIAQSPYPIRRASSAQTLQQRRESCSDGGALRVRSPQYLEVNYDERHHLCETTYRSYGETEEHASSRRASKASRRSSRIGSPFSIRGSLRYSITSFPTHVREVLRKESVARQIRAARAVSLILSCFLVCWLPFLVMWPVKLYCRNCISDWVYTVAVFLNYFCSALNPLLYALSSPRIRVLITSKLTMLGCSISRRSGTFDL